jgi:predicted component of type VI protein secretion system
MIEFRSYRGLEDQGVKSFSASRLVIGSAKQCSLRVTGLAIGGQHAFVERRPSGYFVKDAGLLAGTRVNGSRVQTMAHWLWVMSWPLGFGVFASLGLSGTT